MIDSVNGHSPSSGIVVLPTTIAPAARSRRTTSESAGAAGERAGPAARDLAADVHLVLDRDRHAGQRSGPRGSASAAPAPRRPRRTRSAPGRSARSARATARPAPATPHRRGRARAWRARPANARSDMTGSLRAGVECRVHGRRGARTRQLVEPFFSPRSLRPLAEGLGQRGLARGRALGLPLPAARDRHPGRAARAGGARGSRRNCRCRSRSRASSAAKAIKAALRRRAHPGARAAGGRHRSRQRARARAPIGRSSCACCTPPASASRCRRTRSAART